MGPVVDDVIGPDMVPPHQQQLEARTVVQPKTAFLCLFLRDLKSFALPDVLDSPFKHILNRSLGKEAP